MFFITLIFALISLTSFFISLTSVFIFTITPVSATDELFSIGADELFSICTD
jgi:hypothetical protein